MPSASPLFIVLNVGSGNRDADTTETTIHTILTQAGRRYDLLRSSNPRQLPALAERAVHLAQEQQGIVVVAGGDGTINTVAQAALHSGRPFGVLPQGTFNYFGRAHGIPTDTAEALHVLLHASEHPVQVGLVNDRVFLVNASLGLYPKILEEREAYKKYYGRNRLVALWAAMVTLWRAHRQLVIGIEYNDETRILRTPTLVIGNNRLQLEQLGLPDAQQVHQGQLVAIAVRSLSTLALYGLLVRSAFGQLGTAENILTFPFERLTVHPYGQRRMKVAVDGEITRLNTPLVFQVAPTPLRLLMPAHQTVSAAPAAEMP